jgi:DNA-binding LacI/PurR family transcriptional regulator
MKKKTVRLHDIAAKAGVSINTVSRALRNQVYVNERTRATIFQVAEELGYALPLQASPSNSKRLTIGVLIQDIKNPFFPMAIEGIEQVLWQENANLLFGCSYRQESKERDLLVSFCQQQVDGIFLGSVINPDYILSQLRHIACPVVSISQRFQECEVDYVINDNYKGAMLAMEHVIKLGHTRIAHIAGLDTELSTQERLRGYQDALKHAGIPFDERLLRRSDETMESGYFLSKDLLQVTEDVTAIFAFNDLVALGAARAIREANLQIPTDISLVGYDDIPSAEYLEVPLTTVNQPIVEIGRKATEILCEKIKTGPEHPLQQIILQPRLSIRRSTSVCPRK